MAGMKFVTDLDVESLRKLVKRRAPELGFSVEAGGEQVLRVRKGNFLTSLLLVPYCDFRLAVEAYDDGNELILEWTTPWWTGFVGSSRTKAWARDLMAKFRDEIRAMGHRVSDDKEF